MRPVHLHIEELVLQGVDPRSRHRVVDALHASLAGRFADGRRPIPADSGHRDLVRADAIPRAAAATPERLGTAVGERIAAAVAVDAAGAKP